jgi:hypothetical protein
MVIRIWLNSGCGRNGVESLFQSQKLRRYACNSCNASQCATSRARAQLSAECHPSRYAYVYASGCAGLTQSILWRRVWELAAERAQRSVDATGKERGFGPRSLDALVHWVRSCISRSFRPVLVGSRLRVSFCELESGICAEANKLLSNVIFIVCCVGENCCSLRRSGASADHAKPVAPIAPRLSTANIVPTATSNSRRPTPE